MGRSSLACIIVLTLSGCELVAGIKDIELTGDGGIVDDAIAPTDSPSTNDSPSNNDATTPLDASSDVAQEAGIQTELIDDMEADNGLILGNNGRSGAWFTYNDGTTNGLQSPTAGGTFLPNQIVPPRGSSNYAARTDGSGFTVWGAGMGFNINDPASGPNKGIRATYDASAYAGFVFYARVATGTTAAVRFNVPSKDTDPAGGVCTPAASCGDYFGVNLTGLSENWAMYVVKYSDMKQSGWGSPQEGSFDASAMYGCEFKVDQNVSFDVWIDDIAFLLP